MGINLFQYRQAIGLFNRTKLVSVLCCTDVCCTIIATMMIIRFLLILSGDVEKNPGPLNYKLKKISICHSNVRGLNESKLRSIATSLCEFDIITLSETFLSSASNHDLLLPGYHPIVRRDRGSFGGGVAVFIRENIVYKRLSDFEIYNDLENIWLEINTLEGKILVSIVYRPPNNNMFWDLLDANIEYVKSISNSHYMMLIGDMNSDFSTPNGKRLLEVCSLQNLTYHITEPTRITGSSSSCLDQILTNFPNFVSSTSVDMPVSTNDHCTIGIQLKFDHPKEVPYHRLIWLYDNGDFNAFRQALKSVDWDECFSCDNLDETCEMWTTKVLNTARAFIPNKVVLVRPKDKPWYSNELRLLKRKVKRIYDKAKRTNQEGHWNRYKQLQLQYKQSLDEAASAHKNNLHDKLTKNRNSKTWWGIVRNILGRGSTESYAPIEDPATKSFVYDSKAKANLFNSSFLSHSDIDISNASLPNEQITECTNLIDHIDVHEKEIAELLNIIDVNKATGPDGISGRILKEAGLAIVPSLTKIIKLSLETSLVPKHWKKANVIPIHKKESKNLVTNYRPISLLPIVSKVLERIVFRNLYNFLHQNSLLSVHQSGFRPNDSTINQLSYVYHEFCKALDMKKDVHIVFCDISKAFDKVWHQGLLYKLNELGVKGKLLKWFEDYLSDRKQRVIIRGESSSWGDIMAGVPQGSVLGPLLFLVYINDLEKNVNCNLKMFADDTCIYVTTDNPSLSSAHLNENLANVKRWADQWLVNFNPGKTKSMVITNRNVHHPPLYFDNNQIEVVKKHKHLGIVFNDKLNWSSHISSIVSGVSRMLDVLYKLAKDTDRESLETIYKTFIRSKLEYACIIWDDCTEQDANLLENCQLKAARIVTGAKRGTSHQLLYNEVGWTSLKSRREYFKLCFMQKVVHKIAPTYLVKLLPNTVNSNVHYELRNSENIEQFTFRTEKFRKSLFPDCVRKWNALDSNLQCEPSVSLFKNKIAINEKCPKIYYLGARKINIIHSQLRMKCSNLNAHLYNLHVIDSPKCSCSYRVEDENHFFLECPLYFTQRLVLRNIVSNISNFNVQTLLFGDETIGSDDSLKILVAVHDFIKDTERFV